MRAKNIPKWAVYTLLVLLVWLWQGTPHALPRIGGVYPLLMVPCVVAVAMFEGETPGVAFAVLGGLLCDLQAGRTFGFTALFLMIYAIAASLLIRQLFRNTFVTGLLFAAAAVFIHQTVTWFFFVYLAGSTRYAFAFVRVILPVTAYSAVFMLPLYFLVRFICRRMTNTAA